MGLTFKNQGEKDPEVRKKLNNNKGFKFDPQSHKYLLGGVELVSGTTIVARYKKPFEKGMISQLMANNNKRNKKAYLNTAEDIRRYWRLDGNRAACIGTAGHEFCEMFYLDPIGTVAKSRLERNAHALMTSIVQKYDILEMEVSRGNKTHLIGYTIDIVLRNKVSGSVLIGDFKFAKAFTVEQYREQHKNKLPGYLLDPFRKLAMRNCVQHSGEIQLNLYKKLYEEDTGIQVDGMVLFHVDGALADDWYEKGYQHYVVRDLGEEMDEILTPMKKTLSVLDVPGV